jgi:hypothetical protein
MVMPVALEMFSEAEWKRVEQEGSRATGRLLKLPFDKEPMEWSFPYPVRDTMDFRLRVLMRDELGTQWPPCQMPGLSPPLRAVPAERDTVAG